MDIMIRLEDLKKQKELDVYFVPLSNAEFPVPLGNFLRFRVRVED